MCDGYVKAYDDMGIIKTPTVSDKSYSHFIFGVPTEFSNAEDELWKLKKATPIYGAVLRNYYIDVLFQYVSLRMFASNLQNHAYITIVLRNLMWLFYAF